MKFWHVPRMWRGQTVAILASGPSLTQEQVTLCRDRVRVIAINDQYLMAPWADIHYFPDWQWFGWHHRGEANSQKLCGLKRALALFNGFQGIRATIQSSAAEVHKIDQSVKVLRNDSSATKTRKAHIREGLCSQPDGLRTGSNSGHMAINLAVHTGATRILLLGFDMRVIDGKNHWFGDHPRANQNQKIYETSFIPALETLSRPLRDLGIEVLNCTPGSALKTFPFAKLKETLQRGSNGCGNGLQHSADTV